MFINRRLKCSLYNNYCSQMVLMIVNTGKDVDYRKRRDQVLAARGQ